MEDGETVTDREALVAATGAGLAANRAATLLLHIPKTGGSTLNWVVQQHVAPRDYLLLRRSFDAPDLTAEQLHDAMLAHGGPSVLSAHMSFGLHAQLRGPYTYMTVLRRPVPRVISAFRHLRRDPRSPLHAAAQSMDLVELLESGLLLDLDNGQVRRLAGVGTTLPLGGCTQATLERAIGNIEGHFSVVGITERFDESISLIGDVLGWQRPFYWQQNRGAGRSEPAPTDRGILQAIAERNVLDEKLYDYAVARLDDELARRGPAFERRIRRFARLNKTYFPVRSLPARIKAKRRSQALSAATRK
jgi:Galactose-3-O-sulfotransferase